MRKAISVILAIALVFIIASCSNSAPQPAAEYKGTFYGWDSNDPGLWVKTAKRASGGEYSLEISFDKGIISLAVDGEKIHSYEIKDDSGSLVGKTKVSSIILQSLNNGKEYTVEWTLPAVNGTAVSADDWEVDRTAPKAFAIADGKVSLTTTDANIADDAADRFNRYQGKKVAAAMSAADTWKITSKLSFDTALLDDARFAPSIWLQVADEAGADLDWAIIELKSDAE